MAPRKIALVTGANKGIGFEIARQLTEADVEVIVGARSQERGMTAADAIGAQFVQLDVNDEASAADAASSVERDYGRLDILVNNAGVLHELHRPLPSETPMEIVRRTYATNVFGVIVVTNAFLPLLRRSPAGRIVNLSSRFSSLTRALEPGRMILLAYNSSKTALNAVTLQYANELRETPIKINIVDPGHCATDINGRTGERTAAEAARLPVQFALLPNEGPTGSFVSEEGVVPW